MNQIDKKIDGQVELILNSTGKVEAHDFPRIKTEN
jgi:hypothetical protein